jgi:hypothetical protein
MEVREVSESIHEATGGHGHGSSSTKWVAVLIAALAACLAVAEMGGKSAQTNAVIADGDAANTWAFFQAKTLRMTTVRTAAELAEVIAAAELPADKAQALAKRVEDWRKAANRYDSEPETGEGRRELAARAKQAETRRDTALVAYHRFEYAAAALQLAIVLASASVVTGVLWLAGVSATLGLVGMILAALGWLTPALL